jgi:hypothetical protein
MSALQNQGPISYRSGWDSFPNQFVFELDASKHYKRSITVISSFLEVECFDTKSENKCK